MQVRNVVRSCSAKNLMISSLRLSYEVAHVFVSKRRRTSGGAYTHYVEYTIIGRRGSRVRVDAAIRVPPVRAVALTPSPTRTY
jgi:hypothetical protein